MNVQILDSGVGKIIVKAPYHPDFAPKAKKLGGRWDPAPMKTWTFDARDEGKVRALCVSIYGTDGSLVPRGEILTIRTTPEVCDSRGRGAGSELWLAGRQIARILGRDSGARMGDGVVIVAGRFMSGGSVKNYHIKWEDGTIFELRDVHRALAEKLHSEYHGVTLLDADGQIIEEPTVEPSAESAPPTEEEILDIEIAATEGRLAGLKFRRLELSGYGG